MVEAKGDSFLGHIRSFSLAAAVYAICEERNGRIFKQKFHDWQGVLQRIEESIRKATLFWEGRRTFVHWTICKEWGLNECKMLV